MRRTIIVHDRAVLLGSQLPPSLFQNNEETVPGPSMTTSLLSGHKRAKWWMLFMSRKRRSRREANL